MTTSSGFGQDNPVLASYCSEENARHNRILADLRRSDKLLWPQDIPLEGISITGDLDIFPRHLTGDGCLVGYKTLGR